MVQIQENDIVLCKVKKIEGTTIFLDIENNGEGGMVLSEVVAGRIRNLRDYVSVGRLVVCKVLKINKANIELSLRRVTKREKEQALEKYKQERALMSVLKFVGENAEEIINKIKEKKDVSDLLAEAKENPEVLEEFVPKEKANKIIKAISEKEEKERVVGARFVLKSMSERGVSDIKEILDLQGAEINYLGSGIFSIKTTAQDFKEADNNLEKALKEIEERAKSRKAFFERKK